MPMFPLPRRAVRPGHSRLAVWSVLTKAGPEPREEIARPEHREKKTGRLPKEMRLEKKTAQIAPDWEMEHPVHSAPTERRKQDAPRAQSKPALEIREWFRVCPP